jgi:hypothetical protein
MEPLLSGVRQTAESLYKKSIETGCHLPTPPDGPWLLLMWLRLKIDVEGFEDVVLAPFLMAAKGDMITKRIVIERAAAGDYPACTAAFEKLGYQLTGRTRSNSLYLRG